MTRDEITLIKKLIRDEIEQEVGGIVNVRIGKSLSPTNIMANIGPAITEKIREVYIQLSKADRENAEKKEVKK